MPDASSAVPSSSTQFPDFPRVALVGAGPGDPGLLTLRGLELLLQADFVLYDRLVGHGLLERVPSTARKVCVDDLGPCHAERLTEIQATMIDAAQRGLRVVRLKGGDPMIFGRGGEEALALREANLEYEIVPGVTAALGAASYSAIPLTHREKSSAVAIVTGHEQPGKGAGLDWAALARFPGTLVFYMGLARIETIVQNLLDCGKSEDCLSAIVERCTTANQRTITARLHELPSKIKEANVQAPAIVIVGEVVSFREQLAWSERRPLFGRTVLITRPRKQASEASRMVEQLGGRAVVLPTVEIREPQSWHPVDQAIDQLDQFDWVVFTSVNGVEAFLSRLFVRDKDLRSLARSKLAAIGPVTADALRKYHLKPDLVPPTYNSESLTQCLYNHVQGGRVLLARADRGLDLLQTELSKVARVEQIAVYSQCDAPLDHVNEVLRSGVDLVSLTSSNVARALLRNLDGDVRSAIRSGRVKLVTISPRTTEAVKEFDLPVAAEASEYTVEGVIKAMCELVR